MCLFSGFIHCILVCSCVYIPTLYQTIWKEFKFIPVKKIWFLSADVVHLWLLKNYPFSAVFQLWELVLLFFSQVLLNIYLPNGVIPSISKPALVGGSAVLCVMFIITAVFQTTLRCGKIIANLYTLCSVHSKVLWQK